MPFLDFNHNSPTSVFYDAVVIGSGAAGIFIATRLIKQGLKVLIVESGCFEEKAEFQNLNRIEQTAKSQSNSIWNRKRMLGGTTTAWGGQSLPFSEIDFENRSWISSAWPITHEDLIDHYREANMFMGIDQLNYDTDIISLTGLRPPCFDSNNIYYHFSKWAPQPNFLKLKKKLLDKYADVLYHAHCTKILWKDSRTVAGIRVSSLDGKYADFFANKVFVATGGIESVRMLLLSVKDSDSPLDDHSSLLGKGFMDHPCLQIGNIKSTDSCLLFRLQKLFGTRIYKQWKYSVRISASRQWQYDNKLMNISGGFIFLPHATCDWLENLRLALKKPSLRSIAGLFRVFHLVLIGILVIIRHRFIFRTNAQPVLSIMCEQPPVSESSISLSLEQIDPFGQPLASLNWHIDPIVPQTIRAFASTLKSELSKSGVCNVELYDSIHLDDVHLIDYLSDVNHHMGGARMSLSPHDGVVDQWMRPWGVENLFVCSAAVFPTSSHSNPTLTLLALCSRLLERLVSITTF